MWPVGILWVFLWKKTVGSFINYSECIQYIPTEFFQTYSKKTLHVLHFSTNSQRTQCLCDWVNCEQISEQFVKELWMSGSDIFWVHFGQIMKEPTGFFLEKYLQVISRTPTIATESTFLIEVMRDSGCGSLERGNVQWRITFDAC